MELRKVLKIRYQWIQGSPGSKELKSGLNLSNRRNLFILMISRLSCHESAIKYQSKTRQRTFERALVDQSFALTAENKEINQGINVYRNLDATKNGFPTWIMVHNNPLLGVVFSFSLYFPTVLLNFEASSHFLYPHPLATFSSPKAGSKCILESLSLTLLLYIHLCIITKVWYKRVHT